MLSREKNAVRAATLPLPGELNADYRERMARIQADAAESRRRELSEQVSMSNSPERRIQIWEHLHALPLPRSATHPLLAVVANQTGLTLEQVQDEQRKRQP
jgi:hypothetical protein